MDEEIKVAIGLSIIFTILTILLCFVFYNGGYKDGYVDAKNNKNTLEYVPRENPHNWILTKENK